MRAELERVETDTSEAGALTVRKATPAAASGEQELAGLPAGRSEVLVDGLPGLIRQFEPDRTSFNSRPTTQLPVSVLYPPAMIQNSAPPPE